jgi:hypothetical protein
MKIGLDKLSLSKLQSRALVRAGQTMLYFCWHIFNPPNVAGTTSRRNAAEVSAAGFL